MQKHKHHDVIIQWAKGAEVQWKYNSEWVDDPTPAWFASVQYRIKPRVFINGAFYPVCLIGNPDVAQYIDGDFYLPDQPTPFEEHNFSWIGDELPHSLWEGYDEIDA